MLAHRLKQSSQICKKSAQPTSRSHSRDRQRRSALPSTAARTPYHLTGGAQIPIAQAVPLQSFSRGFLPWRFSDASRQHKSHVVSCGRHPKTFTTADILTNCKSLMTNMSPARSVKQPRGGLLGAWIWVASATSWIGELAHMRQKSKSECARHLERRNTCCEASFVFAPTPSRGF